MQEIQRSAKSFVATFTSHYNHRIQRCLSLQVQLHYDTVDGKITSTPVLTLIHIDENSVYAVFSPKTNTCRLRNSKCRSKEEWESVVSGLMRE
jgi:hypothetical protein